MSRDSAVSAVDPVSRAVKSERRSHRRSPHRYPWAVSIFTLLAAVIFLIPVYILVNLAFKPETGYVHPFVPELPPTLENFPLAWERADLLPALLNSVLVTGSTIAIAVFVAALAAYPLSRSTARWSNATYIGFILGLTVPFQVSMIPLYVTFRDLGLLGTIPGLILYEAGASLPFAVFIFTTFLRNTDRDYEEAAAIDGAGTFRIFWHIVLPLSRAVAGTVAIITGVRSWGTFLPALLFLNGGPETVPIALYGFAGTEYAAWNIVFAGMVIAMVPVLIVYFFLQKQIIQGFAGGLKG